MSGTDLTGSPFESLDHASTPSSTPASSEREQRGPPVGIWTAARWEACGMQRLPYFIMAGTLLVSLGRRSPAAGSTGTSRPPSGRSSSSTSSSTAASSSARAAASASPPRVSEPPRASVAAPDRQLKLASPGCGRLQRRLGASPQLAEGRLPARGPADGDSRGLDLADLEAAWRRFARFAVWQPSLACPSRPPAAPSSASHAKNANGCAPASRSAVSHTAAVIASRQASGSTSTTRAPAPGRRATRSCGDDVDEGCPLRGLCGSNR